eukprot:IDg2541t1
MSDAFEDLSTRMGSLLLYEELGQWDVVEKALGTPYVKYADVFHKQVKKAYGELKTKKAVTSTSDATKKNPAGSSKSGSHAAEGTEPRGARGRARQRRRKIVQESQVNALHQLDKLVQGQVSPIGNVKHESPPSHNVRTLACATVAESCNREFRRNLLLRADQWLDRRVMIDTSPLNYEVREHQTTLWMKAEKLSLPKGGV